MPSSANASIHRQRPLAPRCEGRPPWREGYRHLSKSRRTRSCWDRARHAREQARRDRGCAGTTTPGRPYGQECLQRTRRRWLRTIRAARRLRIDAGTQAAIRRRVKRRPNFEHRREGRARVAGIAAARRDKLAQIGDGSGLAGGPIIHRSPSVVGTNREHNGLVSQQGFGTRPISRPKTIAYEILPPATSVRGPSPKGGDLGAVGASALRCSAAQAEG